MIISIYYFGKECIVVVSNVSKFFCILIWSYVVLFPTVYAGDFKNKVIKFSKINIQVAVANLGERAEYCKQQKKITPISMLDREYLQTINATRHDLLIGLTYLSFNVLYQCESGLRLKLAYAVGSLEAAQSYYGVKSGGLKEINFGLIYPSQKEMELTIMFNKLPENLKKYLVKAVGVEPFDLVKAIDVNKLSALNAECGRAEPYYFPCNKE